MRKLTPQQQRFVGRFTAIVDERNEPITLTERDWNFIQEYLQDRDDPVGAAIRAGYPASVARGRAEFLLKTSRIKAAIDVAEKVGLGIVH